MVTLFSHLATHGGCIPYITKCSAVSVDLVAAQRLVLDWICANFSPNIPQHLEGIQKHKNYHSCCLNSGVSQCQGHMLLALRILTTN